MIKNNISPLNPNKEKFSNQFSQISMQTNSSLHNNYSINNYKYMTKNMHQHQNVTANYGGQITNDSQSKDIRYDQNNHRNQTYVNSQPNPNSFNLNIKNQNHQNYANQNNSLSPNIIKTGPISPTSKIKMFSNTLNKKNVTLTPNHQHKINQAKYQMPETIDLRCNQVLEEIDLDHNIVNKNQQQQSKKNKFPILNLDMKFQDEDLKCDEVLEFQHLKEKKANDFAKIFNQSYKNSELTNKPLNPNENHFNKTSNLKNDYNFVQKVTFTPREDQNKGHSSNKCYMPLIKTNSFLIKNNIETDRQNKDISKQQNKSNNSNNSNNSNKSSRLQPSEKLKSFSTHSTVPPTDLTKKVFQNYQHQNEESEQVLNLKLSQKHSIEHFNQIIQRTAKLLQVYKKKYSEVNQKNIFLQKQNIQLRKIMDQDKHQTQTTNYARNTKIDTMPINKNTMPINKNTIPINANNRMVNK